MPKYKAWVYAVVNIRTQIEVEADSDGDAWDKAQEQANGLGMEQYDTVGDIDCIEVDDIELVRGE
jgi:hypothetical protein